MLTHSAFNKNVNDVRFSETCAVNANGKRIVRSCLPRGSRPGFGSVINDVPEQ